MRHYMAKVNKLILAICQFSFKLYSAVMSESCLCVFNSRVLKTRSAGRQCLNRDSCALQVKNFKQSVFVGLSLWYKHD